MQAVRSDLADQVLAGLEPCAPPPEPLPPHASTPPGQAQSVRSTSSRVRETATRLCQAQDPCGAWPVGNPHRGSGGFWVGRR